MQGIWGGTGRRTGERSLNFDRTIQRRPIDRQSHAFKKGGSKDREPSKLGRRAPRFEAKQPGLPGQIRRFVRKTSRRNLKNHLAANPVRFSRKPGSFAQWFQAFANRGRCLSIENDSNLAHVTPPSWAKNRRPPAGPKTTI